MERTVQTPVLNIGYLESGSASGFPVVLLHGFQTTCMRYDEVAPVLAKAGHRCWCLISAVRHDTFRDPGAPKMAEQAAIGQDLIDFADALKLQRFAVAGYDWGGRAPASPPRCIPIACAQPCS